MRRAAPELRAAGLAVAVVGMGTPEQTAAFGREVDAPFPVLADPERAAYRAYGLAELGAKEFLTLDAAKAMLGAVLRGNRGGRPVGNTGQLGGAFVIDREGTVRWAKPSASPGDHVSAAELLAAVM